MTVKLILSLDFDGVLNSYKSGYGPPGVLPDPPVPGAVEAAHEYDKQFSLHVNSARAVEPAGEEGIREYLHRWKFPPGMRVSPVKPAAQMYIDDRAYQFNGKFPSPDYIASFKPWFEREAHVANEDGGSAALAEIRQLLDENSERLAELSGDKEKSIQERIKSLIARITPKT